MVDDGKAAVRSCACDLPDDAEPSEIDAIALIGDDRCRSEWRSDAPPRLVNVSVHHDGP
jgi:hypothetical protein